MTEDNLPRESDSSLGTEPSSGRPGSASASTTPAAPAPAASASKAPARSGKQRKAEEKAGDPLRGSRASGFYASVAALGVVLLLLIIFIAQNTQKTTVKFLGWKSDNVSVAVALLIAAAAGLFLAVVASSLRILQLRRRVKRDRRSA